MNAEQPVSAPDDTPADRDRILAERIERAERMLDRFAEMAMAQAEALHQAALAALAAGDIAKARELGLAFDRVGRGLRRALALKARLARAYQELADREAAGIRDRAGEKAQRRRQVARAVAGSIGGADSVDAERGEALTADMWERLVEDGEIDAALAQDGYPLEEIVLQLCRDIGIRPDPAWLDPGCSGADRSDGPGAEDAEMPEPPWWPDGDGKDAGRYWYLPKSPTVRRPGWYDTETGQRLDRPPWDIEPDDG
jgi:hypothetical protein